MHTSSLLPTSSFSGPLTWLSATLLAIILHLIFFITYQGPAIKKGAIALDDTGIEIRLKKILPAPTSLPQRKVKPQIPSKPIIKKKHKPIVKPKPTVIPNTVTAVHAR